MLDQKLEIYNINLTDIQKDIILSYLEELKLTLEKAKIDYEVYDDIENSIIEALLEHKDNITDDYIRELLLNIGKPTEIVEPFKVEKISLLEEFKQIFPLSGENKVLFNYYLKLFLKVLGWIGVSLGILGVLLSILLFFTKIVLFNIDLIGSIPYFVKIDMLISSIILILVSSYLLNFKSSKLRNYFLGLNILLLLLVSAFGLYNYFLNFNKLNKYDEIMSFPLNSDKNYELQDVNLFGPITGDIFNSFLTWELTREYLKENKDVISYTSGNKLIIKINRFVLGKKSETDAFNKNISNIKVKIKNNYIYIFRNGYYFNKVTRLLPFYPEIKIFLPKNVSLNKISLKRNKKD